MSVSFRKNLKKGMSVVKRKRFSVEQIVEVLRQIKVKAPVAELIREVGIPERMVYQCKKQYNGLETDRVPSDQR
jgi:putative transposase